MKEGETGRGEHGVRGGGRRREGPGRQEDKGKTGKGRKDGKDWREEDTNAQCQAWLCTEACQWLLAFTLY